MPWKPRPPPDSYDDPLNLEGEYLNPPDNPGTVISSPAGLSEEEDAHRYLALRFNGKFCQHCEVYYEKDILACPKCLDELGPVGSKPKRRKYWFSR